MTKTRCFFNICILRFLPAVLLLLSQRSFVSAQTAPQWVNNKAAAFPDAQWICVVESGRDRNAAQGAAMNALAQVFKVDVQAMTNTAQSFARTVEGSGDRKIAAFTENKAFAQDVTASSNVSGLIGVQSDYWTASDGTVYVNARMNRRECAARYSAMIGENDKVIGLLKQEAERSPASFDAFESLIFALNVAELTDNFQTLLEVLDASAASKRPVYGNANTVRTLAQNAAKSIVITIQVDGDVNSRISKALAAYFTRKGFRTNISGSNSYLLSAALELEDVDSANRNKFVRYLLTASIANNEGREVFSYSGNGREGHASVSAARQRVLRVVEASIGTEGFAKEFDAYLESLLK
ncbi:hypothetical protein AGMMS49546_34620 [Spirochaetia bacterium]|nr:hypothetical protein AGMMS49546_34620 [Spirochaetia bacterium]